MNLKKGNGRDEDWPPEKLRRQVSMRYPRSRRMNENNKGRIEQRVMARDRTARIARDVTGSRAPRKPYKIWLSSPSGEIWSVK
jgi:hypothetical protein